jgi:hypothetical protein
VVGGQPEDFKPEDFQPKEFTPQRANPTYWDWMWLWYENGGYEHVAAYLQQFDVSKFNPKEPPPKTEAFWAIANANRPREENELAELLITMGQPPATTLALMEAAPVQSMKLRDWLNDNRNRRVIPEAYEDCGVRNRAQSWKQQWPVEDRWRETGDLRPRGIFGGTED